MTYTRLVVSLDDSPNLLQVFLNGAGHVVGREEVQYRAEEVLVRPQVHAVHNVWYERQESDSWEPEQLVTVGVALGPCVIRPRCVDPQSLVVPRVCPRQVPLVCLTQGAGGELAVHGETPSFVDMVQIASEDPQRGVASGQLLTGSLGSRAARG